MDDIMYYNLSCCFILAVRCLVCERVDGSGKTQRVSFSGTWTRQRLIGQ